ncbi:MAG: DUF3108 domain-containing protein [Deltaproteobacteria bacterium]|nr:DUF3108 domain-containing protein [Deltaproteobacteria bacterium]
MKTLAATALAILLILAGHVTQGRDRQGDIPFLPGEKLTFEVRWAFVTAGEAVLEILPPEEFQGVKSYHFVMTSRTTPFIDLFYKVRDRIESYTDTGMARSLLYKKTKRGRREKDIVVTLDWEKGETLYASAGEQWDPVPLLPGAFDPLSVFYAFRTHELKEGAEIREAVTDGKKCVMGRAKVLGRERIRIRDREYDTFLVEPGLEDVGGVFEKSEGARVRIWVTADDRRIPVRFESEVLVGSFVAELVSAEGLR